MVSSITRGVRVATGVLAVAVAAAACVSPSGGGDDHSGHKGDSATIYGVGMVGKDAGGTPDDGGTLSFAAYSEPNVLDPARTIVAGTTGGIGMAAVYGVLMRWDPAAKKMRPQLAKSLRHNADYTKWTLTLRKGATFSDGTPLNADAVKWSIHRYLTKGGNLASVWQDNVTSVAAPDEDTVVFSLQEKWPGFQFLLANGPGMIVAPSAVKGGEFTPTGAGPFVFDHHASQEEIVLKANTHYWGGTPHLNKVRIVFLNKDDTKLDSLKSGSVQAALVRDPDVVTEARKDGFGGFQSSVSLGSVAVINASKGRPGHDPRVRKAMFQAINPKVISKRAYGGAGDPSNAVFPEFSRWHTDVKPLPYDPKAARKLLDQAKADGYDGKLTYIDGQDPASRATAVAVKSMLEKVGFHVTLDLVRSVADQTRKVAVDHDYDVAGWGISWREGGPYPKMYATQDVHGDFTVGMPTSQAMSKLIEKFKTAETEQAKRTIAGQIQKEWNTEVPALIYGASPAYVAMTDSLHGAKGTSRGIVLFGHAWLQQAS